eukprot:248047-Chlamydomonas_euryale.AAC.1
MQTRTRTHVRRLLAETLAAPLAHLATSPSSQSPIAARCSRVGRAARSSAARCAASASRA